MGMQGGPRVPGVEAAVYFAVRQFYAVGSNLPGCLIQESCWIHSPTLYLQKTSPGLPNVCWTHVVS